MNANPRHRADAPGAPVGFDWLRSLHDESGASLIEFALLGALALAMCLMLILAVTNDA